MGLLIHHEVSTSRRTARARPRLLAALAGISLVIGGALYLSRSMDRAFVIDAAMGPSESTRPGGDREAAAPDLVAPRDAARGDGLGYGLGEVPRGALNRAPVVLDEAGSEPAPAKWTGPPNRARIRLFVERGGAPLPGSRVSPERAGSATFEGATLDYGLTDANGLVALVAPPGRTVLLLIQGPGESVLISTAVTSPFAETERDVRIELPLHAAGPTVAVRVIDVLTGVPLPKTRATFHTDAGSLKLDTDGEGLVAVPKGKHIHLERAGYSDYTLRHDPRRAADEITVELIPTASLLGRVDGDIPSGATVRAQFWNRVEAGAARRGATAEASVLPDGSWQIDDVAFPEGVQDLAHGSIVFRGTRSRTLAANLQIRPRDRIHVPDPMEGGQPLEIHVQYPDGESVHGPLTLRVQKVGQGGIHQGAESQGGGVFSLPLAPLGQWLYSTNWGVKGELTHDGRGPVKVVLEGRGYVTFVMPDLGTFHGRTRMAWEPRHGDDGPKPMTSAVDIRPGKIIRLDGIPIGIDGRLVIREPKPFPDATGWGQPEAGAKPKPVVDPPILAEAPARAGDRDVKLARPGSTRR